MQVAFLIRQLRYRFKALETISFGASGAANDIRGALGSTLHHIAPLTAYQRLFEPVQTQSGPSGLANQPRPFVLRASHLDGAQIPPGQPFHFDIHLFETGSPALEAENLLSAAFESIASQGIGPARGKAEFTGVDVNQISIDLTSAPSALSRLKVEFCTPTELKGGGALVQQPDFAVLFSRARDRVATLQTLYGSVPPEVDYIGLGDRSQAVATESCHLQQVHQTRRSSRTQQTHGLGGFTGEAIYSGILVEFYPWLEAAQWTGVGRQTTWGKGQIRLTKL